MTTISAIYGARKSAGLDDDTARDLYQRETGKRSLTQMAPGEQLRVLTALRALPGPAGVVRAEGPYGKKLRALWISGWHLGVVRNRRDEALLGFVAERTGIEALRFLRDATDARKAVEALKKWLARDAGVEWTAYADPADCVIGAQGRLLGLDGLEPTDPRPIAQAWRAWRGDELAAVQKHEVMKLFGDAIRRRK